nr:sugar phosphate isomerase/epimerase [Paucibacter sp. M5-1]MCZ7883020.1 sugar phosphate isomerase/epimerase [Paucibacter sp. M5-1]
MPASSTRPPVAQDWAGFRAELDALQLDFIAQTLTRGPDHIGSLREQVLRVAEMKPVLINSHSAADSMPLDEQYRFFEEALELEQRVGIRIAHESHRGRALFTPWHTAALLRRYPALNLGADFSHWCVACERMPSLDDPDMQLSIARAIHIHGRVGYEEGPQVPDPRAPEYARHTELFLQIWLAIALARQQSGATVMTFTPEFGPPPYLQQRPFTGEPAADLWEVNLWMFETFKAQYDERFAW